MVKPASAVRVATLWEMSWEQDRVSCVVYRRAQGLRLEIESPAGTILSEPFELRPGTVARSQALRRSLQRRGWQDLPD